MATIEPSSRDAEESRGDSRGHERVARCEKVQGRLRLCCAPRTASALGKWMMRGGTLALPGRDARVRACVRACVRPRTTVVLEYCQQAGR
jgi:hypothetical protein